VVVAELIEREILIEAPPEVVWRIVTEPTEIATGLPRPGRRGSRAASMSSGRSSATAAGPAAGASARDSVRPLLRWLEHRTDGDTGRSRRHERHLDVRHRRIVALSAGLGP